MKSLAGYKRSKIATDCVNLASASEQKFDDTRGVDMRFSGASRNPKMMAHELAHVIQQRGAKGAIHRQASAVPPTGSGGDQPSQGAGPLDRRINAAIDAERSGGRPIPQMVRAEMEQHFGANLSAVRLHTGTHAERLNHLVRARAFTSGIDVFLTPEVADHSSARGREVLAHELAHVLQNAADTAGPTDRISHAHDPAEIEAARIGRQVAGTAVVRRPPITTGPGAWAADSVAVARQQRDDDEHASGTEHESGDDQAAGDTADVANLPESHASLTANADVMVLLEQLLTSGDTMSRRGQQRMGRALARLDPDVRDVTQQAVHERVRVEISQIRAATSVEREAFVAATERALEIYAQQSTISAVRSVLTTAERGEEVASLGDAVTIAEPFLHAVRAVEAARDALLARSAGLGTYAHLDLFVAAESDLSMLENEGLVGLQAVLGRRFTTGASSQTPSIWSGREADRGNAEVLLASLTQLTEATTEWGSGNRPSIIAGEAQPVGLSRRDRRPFEQRRAEFVRIPWTTELNRRQLTTLHRARSRLSGDLARARRAIADTSAALAVREEAALAVQEAVVQYRLESTSEVLLETELQAAVYRQLAHNLSHGADARLNRSRLRQIYGGTLSPAMRRSTSRLFGFQLGSIGTYPDHPPGAYDLHGDAGDIIVCVRPDEIDLGRYIPVEGLPDLRPGGGGPSTLFRHQSSTVESAITTTDRRDLLSKLVYGLYGRGGTERGSGRGTEIATELEQEAASGDLETAAGQLDWTILARRSSADPGRILAAAVFTHTAGGSDVPLAAERRQFLEQLAPHIRERVAVDFRLPSVAPLGEVPPLRMIQAASGMPSIHAAIAQPFVDRLSSVLPESERDRGELLSHIVGSVRAAVRTTTAVGGALRTEVLMLLASAYRAVREESGLGPESGSVGFSVRSGASVTLRHVYRSAAAQATVHVRYLHLREPLVRPGTAVRNGDTVGVAGTTGNAIQTHVHMEISVTVDGRSVFIPPAVFFGANSQLVPATAAIP